MRFLTTFTNLPGPGHIPHDVPQIVINKTPITHMQFDVQLLGDSDTIVAELCRKLGWELEHSQLPGGLASAGEPELYTSLSQSMHAFKGADFTGLTYSTSESNADDEELEADGVKNGL